MQSTNMMEQIAPTTGSILAPAEDTKEARRNLELDLEPDAAAKEYARINTTQPQGKR